MRIPDTPSPDTAAAAVVAEGGRDIVADPSEGSIAEDRRAGMGRTGCSTAEGDIGMVVVVGGGTAVVVVVDVAAVAADIGVVVEGIADTAEREVLVETTTEEDTRRDEGRSSHSA